MAEKSTAFAVIGDRYHNSDYIRTALGKTLVDDLGLTIDFTDDVKLLNAETLDGYKMLITFRDGMIWPQGYGAGGSLPPHVSEPPVPEVEGTAIDWITEPQAQAVKDFVEGGGVALFYHNSTYIARGNATFRAVLGAATEGHPPVRPFKVRLTNLGHPITQGASDFIVTDEQHYMTYDGDPAHVFMRSINEDGLGFNELGTTCEAGWAYDYGKGRICYLAPGHTVAALWNPAYVKIQQNAVRWLLREI